MSDIFIRSKNNPVLIPNKNNDWESLKVYNCGAIYENNKYRIFYRAVGKGEDWYSSIGYAVSRDGEHFQRHSNPVLTREHLQEEKKGVEDPRITKIGSTYFMTYAAYDGIEPRLHIATSEDLKTWTKKGRAFSDFHFIKYGGVSTRWRNGKPTENRKPRGKDERSKAGGIFPEKIGGKYWMLFNEFRVWLAYSDDALSWKVIREPFLKPRQGNYFDNIFVEMGPPPIKTEKGWLVLYHGIDDAIVYRLGFLLLDISDPTKILYRSESPLFEPKEDYELSGIVDILPGGLDALQKMSNEELKKFLANARDKGFMPKIIFCCGATVVKGMLRIYYGAGDSVICTATAELKNVLSQTK